ncbi:MAG: hypothetical protein A2Y10_05970 [Planctomycetes bacterium GWF2_41_51]|nr:MAG: hypothetical protein A2Y10_05970 [Planctomycetes bacterium GWF2_41_51]
MDNIQANINEYAFMLELIKAKFTGSDAIVILQEMRKDARAAAIQKGYKTDMPATPKQLSYLKGLGIEISEGLTKKQASKLIEDAEKARN